MTDSLVNSRPLSSRSHPFQYSVKIRSQSHISVDVQTSVVIASTIRLAIACLRPCSNATSEPSALQQPAVVAVDLERPRPSPTALTTRDRKPSAQLAPGWKSTSPVRSSRSPRQNRPWPHVPATPGRRPRPLRPARHRCGPVRSLGFFHACIALLDLAAGTSAGRKSATAAAITSTWASALRLDTASRSCAADVTRSTWTPAGSASPAVLPAIRVTSAPRGRRPGPPHSPAYRAAVADETHRIDRFAVPPAGHEHLDRPRRSYGSASERVRSNSTNSADLFGSGAGRRRCQSR